MTCAVVRVEVSSVEGAGRRNVGATFQCWPCSVRTVTVLRLYLVMTPVSRGCPSG